MGKYWLATDLHFGHKTLIEKGYREPDYEARLIKNTFAVLKPGDILIVTGDAALHKAGLETLQNFLEGIRSQDAKAVLVRGNHDSNSLMWYMAHGWTFAADSFTIERHGIRWLFTHEPVGVVPEGTINVHGHWHSSLHRSENPAWPGHILLAAEQMDYRPISLDRLAEIRKTPVYSGGRFVGVDDHLRGRMK